MMMMMVEEKKNPAPVKWHVTHKQTADISHCSQQSDHCSLAAQC